MIEFLANNVAATLFLILALGMLVGHLSIRGISLGSSGVLFVAMLFGHFGLSIPGAIGTLGVVLFVYSVGLQAGPRFFASFRKRGLSFAMLALATLIAGFITTVIVQAIFGIEAPLAAGLYTGALTTTPGLAAALETVDDPNVSVGYGLAYPFGVVGVVLFVQVLPKILKIDLKKEAREVEGASSGPKVDRVWLEVKNPQVAGRSLGDILHTQQASAAISRVNRGERIMPGKSDTVLEMGDKLAVVGTSEQLEQMEMLLGPKTEEFDEPPSEVTTRTLVVTEPAVIGRSLGEMHVRERHGVVVSRMWRDDIEFVPNSNTRMEFGDTLRIVGEIPDCDRFVQVAGDQEKKLHETNFLPLTIGLLIGVLLGSLAIPMPGGLELKLGMAGGPLLAALLLGHFGRIGRMQFRVPIAARIFIRELGLIFFLASAGMSAGANFLEVARSQGVALFTAGLIITIVPLALAYLIARRLMRLDVASTLGAICGGMTSTPGLGVATSAADSDVPALAYATVYPVALIFVTILSQMLGLLLMRLAG